MFNTHLISIHDLKNKTANPPPLTTLNKHQVGKIHGSLGKHKLEAMSKHINFFLVYWLLGTAVKAGERDVDKKDSSKTTMTVEVTIDHWMFTLADFSSKSLLKDEETSPREF